MVSDRIDKLRDAMKCREFRESVKRFYDQSMENKNPRKSIKLARVSEKSAPTADSWQVSKEKPFKVVFGMLETCVPKDKWLQIGLSTKSTKEKKFEALDKTIRKKIYKRLKEQFRIKRLAADRLMTRGLGDLRKLASARIAGTENTEPEAPAPSPEASALSIEAEIHQMFG